MATTRNCTSSFSTLVLAALLCPAVGRIGFLASDHSERISVVNVEASLLHEFAGALGQGSHDRITRIEAMLRPMYTALPKNKDGTLSQAVVRYALHRFFVQQHGWYVKGLEPNGDSWNATSPTMMLKDRVPDHVLALVEEHLGGRGFALHELAVLAATLDDLIHSEAIERLTKAYSAYDIPVQSTTDNVTADLIVQTYMMFYILPNQKLLNLNSNQLQRVLPKIHKAYPGWDDTMLWVRDLQNDLDWNERMERNPFQPANTQEIDFPTTARTVEEIGAQFGKFQDLECRSLKWELLDMEEGDTGRVLLTNFYGHTLNGGWQFKESVDYLRHLGALDESDPKRVSVVIPNYLNGRSNCLAASNFYSVCCIDECESLMTILETKIEAPTGSPAEIVEVVSATHSDTIDAPRNLSVALLDRLNEIAAHHGGKVPLHGRLFAQWLHHAYPRECPYPQPPGSSNAPMTPAEWMKTTNAKKATLTKEEMAAHVNVGHEEVVDDANTMSELPWSNEEVLVMHAIPDRTESSWFRTVVCLALLVSATLSILRMGQNAISAMPGSSNHFRASKVHDSHFV